MSEGRKCKRYDFLNGQWHSHFGITVLFYADGRSLTIFTVIFKEIIQITYITIRQYIHSLFQCLYATNCSTLKSGR